MLVEEEKEQETCQNFLLVHFNVDQRTVVMTRNEINKK